MYIERERERERELMKKKRKEDLETKKWTNSIA
jgi:hypothetical protein